MYNRYIGNTGKYYRVSEPHDYERYESRGPRSDGAHFEDEQRDFSGPGRDERRGETHERRRGESDCGRDPGARQKTRDNKKKPSFFNLGGLKGVFDSILPFGLDMNDLILLLLFLFLFIESGDEEFLIILAFLTFSIFRSKSKDGEKQ